MNFSNDWADFEQYEVGINVIPALNKTKIPKTTWKKWEETPIPLEIHNQWKEQNPTLDSSTNFEDSNSIETELLDKDICYFCGDEIYNHLMVKLFDGRNVKSCFECNDTLQLGLKIYYNKLAMESLQ